MPDPISPWPTLLLALTFAMQAAGAWGLYDEWRR